jgi:hypothetical protein
MISRKIFGEFMEILSKGLNPFKIQANLIFDLFPGFSIQPQREFEVDPKWKFVCLEFIYQLAKFEKCWS